MTGQRDGSWEIEGEFTYRLCSRCRLRFQTIPPEQAANLYAGVENRASLRKPSARHWFRCDQDILRVFQGMGLGRRLLDLGSGDGYFLAAARAAGFDCVGVDVSEELAEIARRRSGAPVLVGDLVQQALPSSSLDIVNIDLVMMYISEPGRLLREVNRLLRPGGICRIREFDADSVLGRLRGKRYWMYGPTKVNVWSRKAIETVAAEAGLPVRRVYPGTEATLGTWLSSYKQRGLVQDLRSCGGFFARHASLLGWNVASDMVFYLQKSKDQ
jgi:hypothetical protein